MLCVYLKLPGRRIFGISGGSDIQWLLVKFEDDTMDLADISSSNLAIMGDYDYANPACPSEWDWIWHARSVAPLRLLVLL